MFRVPYEKQTVYLSGSWDLEHSSVNLFITALLAEHDLIVIGDHPSRPTERGMNYAARVNEHMQNCSGIVLVFPFREPYKQSTSSPMFVELLLAAKYRLPTLLLLEEGVVLTAKVGDNQTTFAFGSAATSGTVLTFDSIKDQLEDAQLNYLHAPLVFEASVVVVPTPPFIDCSIRLGRSIHAVRAAAPTFRSAIEAFVQSLVTPRRPQHVFHIAPYDRRNERTVVADTVFRVTGLRCSNASDQWAGAPFASEKEIAAQISDAQLVIADLTGSRLACVFEAGYAIGAGRPTAIVRMRSSDKMPFGLGRAQLLEYENEDGLRMAVTECCKPFRRRVFSFELDKETELNASDAVETDDFIEREPARRSATRQGNQYNFYAPVTGSGFADGGTVILNDPSAIFAVIAGANEHRTELALSTDQARAFDLAIAGMQNSITEKGTEPTLLRDSLSSLRHILEHAAGVMVAHGAPAWLPVLSDQIQAVLKSLS